MDDLISRQAAIEAMTADNLSWNLDSVHDDDMKRAARAAQRALARLPAAQRWIPVTERMPEAFQKVLVFWWEHSEPMMDTAFWQKDALRFVGNHWIRIEDKITHWRELPEPPKEEP